MATKWRGDDSNQLPALQVEPYRLWFEFLKLASKDRTVKINKALYKTWGRYEDLEFREWWSVHWRSLFSVSVGVRLLDSGDGIKRTDSELIVSIPLYQDKGRTVSQIKQLLEEHDAGTQIRKMPTGHFFLNVGVGAHGGIIDPSTRFLKNLSKMRLFMHLYRFWLKHPDLDKEKRLDAMSKDYFAWADSWNRKIRERKWNRNQTDLPPALAEYVRYLEKRGSRQRLALSKYNESDTPNNRRQVARYLRKARQIAANVGEGIFPGIYE